MKQREIKFKAWDKKRSVMVDVSLIDFTHNEPYLIVTDDYVWDIDPETQEAKCCIDLKDSELLQFTGLEDKNGKEIYDGDIIKHSYRSALTVIEWRDKEAQWSMGGYGSESVEVIGNIYENPNLLNT